MASIFRLDDSTLYLCDTCLNDLGPVPGKWVETPLETCSVCGEVDLQSQEEMDAWHHDQSNQQWEQEQQDETQRFLDSEDPPMTDDSYELYRDD